MQRRKFIGSLVAGIASTAWLPATAFAQAALGAPVVAGGAIAGQTYAPLASPVAQSGGRLEVLEFFSYGCPHCNDFSEPFAKWAKQQQAKGVSVRRVPVTFGRPQWVVLGRLYYTIELLKLSALDAAAFNAIHGQGKMLYDDQAVLQWASSQPGVNAKQFTDTYYSAEVTNLMKKADLMAATYQIDAVPSLVVAGRYRMLQQRGMSFTDLLANTDAVIKLARDTQK
ncbi:MAG: thiol:disulfide interchange protein DsbA/DsbL [Fluviibacter sp.]